MRSKTTCGSFARRQIFAASPSYSATRCAQSACVRLPMADGNRCSAGFCAEHLVDRFGTHGRDLMGVEPTQTRLERRRTLERPLHRDLLVEQHPDQQRQGIVDEELIGVGITGDGERRAGPCGEIVCA